MVGDGGSAGAELFGYLTGAFRPSAQQLQEYSVLQNAGNIIVPVANNGVAQT